MRRPSGSPEVLRPTSYEDAGRFRSPTNVELALASNDIVLELIEWAAAGVEGHRFSPHFLWTEWSRVVDVWHLESWEAYRDVVRLGRKTRLAGAQRVELWSIFSKVQDDQVDRGLLTEPRMFRSLTQHVASAAHPPYEYCVIDEAQYWPRATRLCHCGHA